MSSNKISQEEAFMAVPLLDLNAQRQIEEEAEQEEEFSWASCGESCLLAILPCLLFIQFGVAYLTENPPQLHWLIVNLGIVAFIVTALFFRRAFSEPDSLVALIPEVLIDVILGLILFEKTDIASAVMFLSIFGMGIVAVFKVTSVEQETIGEEEKPTRRGEFNA